MKVIEIDSFVGGKNEYDLQALINDNECASGSTNVWAPQKVLTKTPGYSTVFATLTATGLGMASMYADSLNTSYVLYARISSSVTNSEWFPWAIDINGGATPLGYVTGGASLTGISATGSGTTWSTHVSAGDLFRIDATANAWKRVLSVEDNTHLTLSGTLPGNSGVAAYTIMPSIDRQEIPWASLAGSWWTSCTANIMQQYNGSGMLRVAAGPKAAFLSAHKNYLFGARTSTAESRVYWSTIKDPTSWPTSNFIDVDKDKGKITGLISYGNELIVFKSYGMYKIVGEIFDPSNPTYQVIPIATPASFQFNSSQAVAIHDGILYFYAYGQVWAYQQGTVSIQMVSRKFQLDLPNIAGQIFDLTSSENRIHAISFGGYLIFKGFEYLTGAKTGAGIIDQNGAWWFVRSTNDSTSVSNLGLTRPAVIPSTTSAKPRLMIGSDTYPHILVWDMLSFTGFDKNYFDPSSGASVAIDATWISKEINIEHGTFKHAVIYLGKQSAGNLTFSWSVDQGTYVDNTVDMTTGRGNIIRKVLDINQKGSTIQLKINQAVASQTFQIYKIRIFYEPYEEDRRV